MPAVPNWAAIPPDPKVGQPGPIAICDFEGGPEGRTVFEIAGQLLHRRAGGDFDRLLDEEDLANFRLLLAAPRPRATLEALQRWATLTGGWEAPCWREAETLLREIDGHGLRSDETGP
jgi:hypothetical protein